MKHDRDSTKINRGGRFVLAVLLAAALSAAGAAAGFASQKAPAKPAQVRVQDLNMKHRDWLNLVAYIITDKEKEVFFQLTNDRDRDIFIDSFWKLRDPTPGTPENEFREEHIRRFNHANKELGRGSGKPGWMTDRGRYYIILGRPNSMESFYGSIGLLPIEVWYYYTDGRKGLPPHFGLVFFQRGGSGEFKLYDPVVDGPKALMLNDPETAEIASDDYEAMYERMQTLAPTLADMSISLIPGEYGYGYQPSTRGTILIANITDSPKADIRPTYATNFLSYKGLVSTEYMSNFVDSEAIVAVLRDPLLRTNFLHFAVKPATVGVDYFEAKDQYFCNYTVSVSLRPPDPKSEEIIFQYTKDFPFYFPPSDVDKIRANGIAIEDLFPVLEGRYRLTVLIQNSVAKEFCLLERDIVVPADDGKPSLVGPLIGYKFQDYSANLQLPFKMLDKKLIVDPQNTFAKSDTIAFLISVQNAGEELWRDGRLRVQIVPASGRTEGRKTIDVRLRDYPLAADIPVFHLFPAEGLPPDYYQIEAVLLDGQERAVATSRGPFIISTQPAVGHPIARMKGFPPENRFLYFGMLAQQAAKTNDRAKADAYYKQALSIKPDFTRGWADYAQFLLRTGRYDQAMEAAERFKDDGQIRFEYLALRGRALKEKGTYAEAVKCLLEANKIYNSDTELLKTLGFCFYKLGQKKEALDSLNAALRLNSGLADVKALIAEVEKSLK